MSLASPFLVTGFDHAENDIKRDVSKGLLSAKCGYLGVQPLNNDVPWLQLVIPGQIEPSNKASALIYAVGHQFKPVNIKVIFVNP